MDEFDKIRQLSEDIVNRKEPTFSGQIAEPENPFQALANDSVSDDAGLYLSSDEMDKIPNLDIQELEEKHFSSMKLHLIALVIFIGILVVVLVCFFFAGNADEENAEIVTIAATSTPVKVKPEQPGGMVIPDQDKLVYNRIRANEVPTKIEHLFPEPEKPVLPEIVIETPVLDTKEVPPSVQPVVEEVPPTPKKEVIPLPKKIEQPASKKVPAKTSAKKEEWRAQLLSSSNKQSVEKAWPTILKKNKALLSNMSYDIVSAKIPGKGTFYRLQVGQFATRDMAAGLCAKLKARKQECVPVKK